MNCNYQHYIITRFSLIIKGQVPSDEWYKQRLEVFRKYTLPSVLGQTDQNFKWICLIGQEQDKKYFDNTPIIPLLVTPQQNFKGRIRTFFERYCSTQWLITTRLDNDDALNRNYVKLVHRLPLGKDYVVNYVNGVVVDDETGQLFDRRILYPNPFITLIERPSQLKTVYFVKHGDMNQHFIINNFTIANMWLMVCHEFNLANTVMGKISGIQHLGKLGFSTKT